MTNRASQALVEAFYDEVKKAYARAPQHPKATDVAAGISEFEREVRLLWKWYDAALDMMQRLDNDKPLPY